MKFPTYYEEPFRSGSFAIKLWPGMCPAQWCDQTQTVPLLTLSDPGYLNEQQVRGGVSDTTLLDPLKKTLKT